MVVLFCIAHALSVPRVHSRWDWSDGGALSRGRIGLSLTSHQDSVFAIGGISFTDPNVPGSVVGTVDVLHASSISANRPAWSVAGSLHTVTDAISIAVAISRM